MGQSYGDWRTRATRTYFRHVLCVLLVRFSSIGDVLLTTPLVRALARRHPEAKLVYVTKRAMAPLVADNPHLADIVTLEPDEPMGHLARRLRALAPTHGLDLHGSLRSAGLRLLVRCRWSGYRKRKLARALLIATKLDAYRRRASSPTAPPSPVAERYFEAAHELDTRPDGGPPEFCLGAGARDEVARWLAERGLTGARLAALAPGAAHATKRWPIAHWSALAGRLAAAGYRAVVVGGPEDRGLAQQLVAEGGGNPVVSAAGEFSLQETGALLARARVVVSGDTGVMHMATGVGTPVVALFGPTVAQFGFFPYQARAVVLERALDCRPCSSTGTATCPLGHHRCLADITPEDAAAAVERLVA
jgi:lipopolysaccharide heptosyltransferase II